MQTSRLSSASMYWSFLMSVQHADQYIISSASMDWSFPLCAGKMRFVSFQLVNPAWVPEITCICIWIWLVSCCIVAAMLCLIFSEMNAYKSLAAMLDHMLLTPTFRNIAQSWVLLATWGCGFAAFLEFFVSLSLNLSGACKCKLQSKIRPGMSM